MKILLLENIKGLGQIGDIHDVRDGYARNFLLPKRLAKLATQGTEKEREMLKAKLERRRTEAARTTQEVVKKLEGFVLEIPVKTNETGSLYATLPKSEILSALKKHGVQLEEKNIILAEPIKKIGESEIKIRLEPDTELLLKLNLVSL